MSLSGGATDRILLLLDDTPSRTFSVHEVHREISEGRKHKSTARQLERMEVRGLILSPFHGYYQSKRSEELPILTPSDIRFHAPILQAQCRLEGTWSSPQARQNATNTYWHTLLNTVQTRFDFDKEIPENGGLCYRGEFDTYPILIMLYPTKQTAMVYIQGTSPRPFSLLDFIAYLRFWPELTRLPAPFWYLRQFDANIDARGIQVEISFRQRMSVGHAMEVVAKWYQKEVDLLRMESRIQGRFPVDELTAMFREVIRLPNILRLAEAP